MGEKEKRVLETEERHRRAEGDLKLAALRYAKWKDEPLQEPEVFKALMQAARSFTWATRQRSWNTVLPTNEERYRGGMLRKMRLLVDDPDAYKKLGKKAGLISQAKHKRCGCFGVWHSQAHPKCRYNPNGRETKG